MLTNKDGAYRNVIHTNLLIYLFTRNRYVKRRILHVMRDADAISRVKKMQTECGFTNC